MARPKGYKESQATKDKRAATRAANKSRTLTRTTAKRKPKEITLRRVGTKTIDAPSVKKPIPWTVKMEHPTATHLTADKCPECEFPEAMASYCPNCGWFEPIVTVPKGTAHGPRYDVNGKRIT